MTNYNLFSLFSFLLYDSKNNSTSHGNTITVFYLPLYPFPSQEDFEMILTTKITQINLVWLYPCFPFFKETLWVSLFAFIMLIELSCIRYWAWQFKILYFLFLGKYNVESLSHSCRGQQVSCRQIYWRIIIITFRIRLLYIEYKT